MSVGTGRATTATYQRFRYLARSLVGCVIALGLVIPQSVPAGAAPSSGTAAIASRAAPSVAAAEATAAGTARAGVPTALSECTRNTLRRVRLLRTGLNIDRNCQLMYVTRNGEIIRVWRATTGKPGYRTRAGYWRIFRRVNGWQESGLYRGAWMYRPMYFSGGQAIHGSSTDGLVVPWPASHGCVRIYRANVDWLWRNGYSSIGTRVYVF